MNKPYEVEVEKKEKSQQEMIDDAVKAALQEALGENGAITTAISTAITTAIGENGAITTAISTAITTAIGENGAIETWADGRYEPKTTPAQS